MNGEMDWIAARFLLSAVLGVHPLVVMKDDHPRDDDNCGQGQRVMVPAAVAAPAGVSWVCAVCTEEVAAGQAVVWLPCAHWYHAACIKPWLRIRPNCPTCRAELPRETAGSRPRLAEAPMETAGRLRREASCTMLAGMLPS